MTEGNEPAQSGLMVYRPVSQMVQMFVLPEVDRRVESGAIAEDDLPLPVLRFRIVQPGPGHTVELNEEVQLVVRVKAKKAVRVGRPVYLEEIDPATTVLAPPIVDGMPRSFFLLLSAGWGQSRTLGVH